MRIRPATAPARPPRAPRDPERADRELLRVLADRFEASAARAGEWLVCGPGCSTCCIGPFPITRLDSRRLRGGLDGLRRGDPARAARLVGRARLAVEALREGFPGDADSGRLEHDVRALDRFFERHAALACPVLDPQKGTCELYESRPVACRVFGPPLAYGDEKAPPCELCFRGAPDEVVEACRFDPDPEGREEALLRATGGPAGDDWETLIAFAVIS